MNRALIAVALCVGLGLAGCAAAENSASAPSTAAATTTSSTAAASSANTVEVVDAAEAFLTTLSDAQRQSVVLDFNDPARTAVTLTPFEPFEGVQTWLAEHPLLLAAAVAALAVVARGGGPRGAPAAPAEVADGQRNRTTKLTSQVDDITNSLDIRAHYTSPLVGRN